MMVWQTLSASKFYWYLRTLTVFPDPLSPTIKVKGVKNWMTSGCALSKERMLLSVSGSLLGLCFPFVLPSDREFVDSRYDRS